MAKYLVLFGLTDETIKRFVATPSDRAAVMRGVAGSVGSFESYYWMFGRYDGIGVFELPDSRTMAALSPATSSGVFTHFETHELIEAGDLTAIAERAKGSPTSRQAPDTRRHGARHPGSEPKPPEPGRQLACTVI